jgi:hypothetical protein
MKSLRFMLPFVLMCLTTLALAQAETPKPDTTKSEAEKSFDTMKTLAGQWEGPVTVDPPQHQMSGSNKPMHISMRVTSRGHALVHEMQEAGTPLDPTRYDHPVTMFYLDDGQLTLVHYCDAGNRPRMTGTLSQDGKQVEFTLVDISGSTQYGHMDHAVFTIIDANHHTEDWTYIMPGDKPVHAHFDLHRVQ